MSTIEPPVLVLNPHVALAQTAEPQRPKVDGPDAVVDLLKADVFADADSGHVHPPAVPPNAAVGAHVAHLEAIGVLERRQPVGHWPSRRGVEGARGLLASAFCGPLVVEF